MKESVRAAVVLALLTFAWAAADIVPASAQETPTCFGEPATMVGTPGNDYLHGTVDKDVIVGLEGNDILLGLASDDLMCGGDGNDSLIGYDGNDREDGGAGRRRVFGVHGSDELHGGEGDDMMTGGQADPGDDLMYGEDSNDSLLRRTRRRHHVRGPGDDLLRGHRGPDTMTGDDGDDLLVGEDDNDVLDGGRIRPPVRRGGADALQGGTEDDILDGWGPDTSTAVTATTFASTASTAPAPRARGSERRVEGRARPSEACGGRAPTLVGTSSSDVLRGTEVPTSSSPGRGTTS
jgi:Ca2+-binding RTX toxin-like protein